MLMLTIAKKTMTTLMLKPEERAIVREILMRFCPNAEVWVFGSRAMGTAKRYSDLDLLIKMDSLIPLQTMFLLRDAFEESNLVFTVDIVDWHRITQEFRQTIAKDSQKFPYYLTNN